jgi:hypothetical protein
MHHPTPTVAFRKPWGMASIREIPATWIKLFKLKEKMMVVIIPTLTT